MQTFLPYPDYFTSAACLDRQRLGKQRVEVYQILNVLTGKTNGWRNHPAVRMWTGCEGYLAAYGMRCSYEWTKRGYKDTLASRFAEVITRFGEGRGPGWFGDPAFHASHRANLLRKDPVFYGQYGWTEDPSLPYVWPGVS